MKCKDCDCCEKGWFDSNPNHYVCIGVKKPFIIKNINNKCIAYPEKRTLNRIDELKYGTVKEFEIGTTLWYEPVTDVIDGFVLRGYDGNIIKVWT